MTYRNIASGFHACGLWNKQGEGLSHNIIKDTEITNRQGASDPDDALLSYKKLYNSFVRSRRALASDTEIVRNSHLKSSQGLLIYREEVIDALRRKDMERAQRENEQKVRVAEREQRASKIQINASNAKGAWEHARAKERQKREEKAA